MDGQATDNVDCTIACLLLFKNGFLSKNAFKSLVNKFFSSLSKRTTNLLVAGLLKVFIDAFFLNYLFLV